MKEKDKVFIVPKNDLESVEIIKMLQKEGYEIGKDLLVTNQAWGASWDGLENEIKEKMEELSKIQIYGVELKGDAPRNAHNIDHHNYLDKNWETGEILYQDDRTVDENGNRKHSSISQVAELIGRELSLDQQFVAANDVGFVDQMRRYGQHIGLEQDEINKKVLDIRMREHEILAQVQGITPKMEQQAIDAINKSYQLENGCTVVELPHSKCATVTDRIPNQEYEGGLLIKCGDGEFDYYGPSEIVNDLQGQFGGWTGNTEEKYTFWGTTVEPEQIQKFGQQVENTVNERDGISGAAAGDLELER